jgi:hypothetical protein
MMCSPLTGSMCRSSSARIHGVGGHMINALQMHTIGYQLLLLVVIWASNEPEKDRLTGREGVLTIIHHRRANSSQDSWDDHQQ